MENVSFVPDEPRVAYVLKMYPRYSETFIVNEILAHEAAGLDIEIFSLRSPVDTHFQDIISLVRSPVNYVPADTPRAAAFWSALGGAAADLTELWSTIGEFAADEVGDVFQAVLLAQAARRKRITHFHAHFGTIATEVARIAGRLAGIPYTFTAHAKDIFHSSVSDADMRRKLRDARAVITVSDYNLRYLRERHGKSASRVRRIYNGLDLARFPYSPRADRACDIVAVGRLVEKKGFGDLITACAILRDRGNPIVCRIIGAGELEVDLRESIRALALDESVVIVGPCPQGIVLDEMKRARILVVPCVEGCDGNRDGLPTVLLEAMALGTPCVGTPIGGIPEVIEHEETGLLSPAGDPAALADQIARLLGDERLRLRVSENARRRVEAEFDIHRNTARQRELFTAGRVSETEAA